MEPLSAATAAADIEASDELMQLLQSAADLLAAADGDGEPAHALAAIETQLQELAEHVGALTQAYDGALQALDESSQALEDELDELRSSVQDHQAALEQRGEQFAGSELPDISDAADEGLSQAESRWAQLLGDEHGRLVDAFDENLRDASATLGEQLQVRSQALAREVADQLEHVGETAAAAFAQRVAQEAREAGEELVKDMGREIAEQMLLSQASIAITGALGPLLPQLVALRMAVGAIKTALKIARGGF